MGVVFLQKCQDPVGVGLLVAPDGDLIPGAGDDDQRIAQFVFLYEGIIALSATTIEHIVPKAVFTQFIQEMSATGGIMILAIGLNIAKITSIRVANLLPSLIVVGVVVFLMQMI